MDIGADVDGAVVIVSVVGATCAATQDELRRVKTRAVCDDLKTSPAAVGDVWMDIKNRRIW